MIAIPESVAVFPLVLTVVNSYPDGENLTSIHTFHCDVYGLNRAPDLINRHCEAL